MIKHPAKYSQSIIVALKELLPEDALILDPFAGVGRIHQIHARSVGLEIEYEWAAMGKPNDTLVGNALHLPFAGDTFDGVCTSPTYGNRLADHHNARDASRRRSYTHDLGRTLHPSNSGTLQWGEDYRTFHYRAWREIGRVIKSDGILLLNISNHVRAGKEIHVAEWHRDTIQKMSFALVDEISVGTPRLRYGENANLRVSEEKIYVFKKETKQMDEYKTPLQRRLSLRRDALMWEISTNLMSCTKGEKGAVIGLLQRKLNNNADARRIILGWLFDRGYKDGKRDRGAYHNDGLHPPLSSKELYESEWYALFKWIGFYKEGDDDEWHTFEYLDRELSEIYQIAMKEQGLLDFIEKADKLTHEGRLFEDEETSTIEAMIDEAVKLGGEVKAQITESRLKETRIARYRRR